MNLVIDSATSDRIVRSGLHIGQMSSSISLHGSSLGLGKTPTDVVEMIVQTSPRQLISLHVMNAGEIFQELVEISSQLRERGYPVNLVQSGSTFVIPEVDDLPLMSTWTFVFYSSTIFPLSSLPTQSPGYVEVVMIEDTQPIDLMHLRVAISQNPVLRFVDIAIFSPTPRRILSTFQSHEWVGRSFGIHVFPTSFLEPLTYS